MQSKLNSTHFCWDPAKCQGQHLALWGTQRYQIWTLSLGNSHGEGEGWTLTTVGLPRASQVALMVKNLPVNAGDAGSIPWSGRSHGGGRGNPLQYSCLENPKDRGDWQARPWVAKTQTWLKRLSILTGFTTLSSLGWWDDAVMDGSFGWRNERKLLWGHDASVKPGKLGSTMTITITFWACTMC